MNLNFNEDLTITNNKDSSSSECVSIIAPSPPAATTPANVVDRIGSATRIIIDRENGTVEAESTGSRSKLALLRYKGVVLLPNGRWGAQIYEKHQRIWLGTFNEEHEAARVYDVAAQRFYGREAITNFKPLGLDDDESIFEFSFISSHSKAEIVDMLRKHTYIDELEQRKRNLASSNTNQFDPRVHSLRSRQISTARESLFEKAVTPSDVGKLNRFVIPKQHAEKHFPLKGRSPAAASKGVILHFEDAGGKVWRFRYSYWKSSQSYILTKGWIKFVKEKNLQAGDVVSFYKSRTPDGQLYIDFSSRACRLIDGGRQSANGCLIMSENNVFRLFGVDIVKDQCSDEDEGVGAVKTRTEG